MEDNLKALITPSLLDLTVENRIPFPADQPLNFAEVSRNFFSAGDPARLAAFRKAAWPPLLALSKIGLDDMPDLLQLLLPPPSHPSFPKQCLGLQLLIDQGPRALFAGVDRRWQTGYFDVVSQRFAASWRALPERERPDSLARWTEGGATLDYWLYARLWFGAPFVHSESVANQVIALEYTDSTRRAVEAASGMQDPWRERRQEVLGDVYGFPRVVAAGPPEGPVVSREEWCWWYGMLMDIHKPIIDKFGRYPYNNAAQGRESTDEELEWIEKTEHFAEASPEVARQVKEDVVAGIWRPLGTGSSTNIEVGD